MGDIVRGPQGGRSFSEFRPFSPTSWTTPAPALSWLVDGCFLRGTVAILSGDGGLGKSLLLQQLVTAAATGRQWLGINTARARSFAMFCEDDIDELKRRQERINTFYGCTMADLEPVQIESRAGRDAVLMNFPRWGDNGQTTPMMDQVRYAAKQHKAQIVILDTVADVFSGNEIDRNQPRRFIRELRSLAIELQGVIILTQHPSVDGLATGTGRSGSTAWNNSVRSRLYLTEPKKKADDDAAGELLLKTVKSNSGPRGGKIRLRWYGGVFRRVEEQGSLYYTEGEPDHGEGLID